MEITVTFHTQVRSVKSNFLFTDYHNRQSGERDKFFTEYWTSIMTDVKL